MATFKVREDFANHLDYENYKRKLFLDQISSFLIRLKNTTLINYDFIITSGINSEGITSWGMPGTEELAKFYKIVLCHERLKQVWLRKVKREIFSSFGGDAFLMADIIRESGWLEHTAFLLFDNAYIAYLIKEFGIEHDLSNKEEVSIAYNDAIISQNKESQKPLSKKLIQQLVKEEQNAVQNRNVGKAAEPT